MTDHNTPKRFRPEFFKLAASALGILWVMAGVLVLTGVTGSDWRRLFEENRYTEAIDELEGLRREYPDRPEIRFFLGRCHLADQSPEKALMHFSAALEGDASKADWHFWKGVAHWALIDFDGEMASYQAALDRDDTHLSARLYLGHNHLDRGQWKPAMQQYERVLALDPGNEEALYNSGLAARGAGDSAGEGVAWERYLDCYRSGENAFRAVERLNAAGVFTYRLYTLGSYRAILRSIAFEGDSDRPDETSRQTLDGIGRLLMKKRDLKLHVVVYEKGNAALARRKAEVISKLLAGDENDPRRRRIRASWFDGPEVVSIDGSNHRIERSVRLFTDLENRR